MSQHIWTHLTATISVNTKILYTDKYSLSRESDKLLRKAPKIKGSVGDADVKFFTQKGVGIKRGNGGWLNYYGSVTISIQGALRDRKLAEVKADFAKFVAYINKVFTIDYGSYGINGFQDIQDEYFGSTAGMIKDFIPKHGEEVKINCQNK